MNPHRITVSDWERDKFREDTYRLAAKAPAPEFSLTDSHFSQTYHVIKTNNVPQETISVPDHLKEAYDALDHLGIIANPVLHALVNSGQYRRWAEKQRSMMYESDAGFSWY